MPFPHARGSPREMEVITVAHALVGFSRSTEAGGKGHVSVIPNRLSLLLLDDSCFLPLGPAGKFKPWGLGKRKLKVCSLLP